MGKGKIIADAAAAIIIGGIIYSKAVKRPPVSVAHATVRCLDPNENKPRL